MRVFYTTMEPDIIFSNEHFIIVNKPAGIPVHGGDRVIGPTLADVLLEKFPEIKTVGDEPALRPGIVHRLDKDTSGVMVIARTQEVFLALKKLFQERRVEKIYHAIVCGSPKETSGMINFPIGRLVANPLKRGVAVGSRQIRGEREAITEFRVVKSGEKFSLLELKPKTGRMHQIRVHCAAIHHPVACDQIYGGKKVCCPGGMGRQPLHARTLSFSYPEGKRWSFEADYPEDFAVAVRDVL